MNLHWRWILSILQSVIAVLLLTIGTYQENAQEAELANSMAAAARSPRRDGDTVEYQLPPFWEHYRPPAAQIVDAISFPAVVLAAPWNVLPRVYGSVGHSVSKGMLVLTIAFFWYWFGCVIEKGIFARGAQSRLKPLIVRFGLGVGLAASLSCLLLASRVILPVLPVVGMAGVAWSLLFLVYFGIRMKQAGGNPAGRAAGP